jgi:hypothetical protein
MNNENTETQIVAAPKREIRVVEDAGPLANLFDTARFEHMGRIANMMASASLIPDHMWMNMKTKETLADTMIRGNCFLVVNQAIRWGMDPFAVVPSTYVVAGKLGFEGKLIAAVINSRAPIKASLDYEFSGTKGKDDFTVRVFATLKGEDRPREIKLSVGDAKTENKMWTKDPEQKLVYSGATKWARRHCPEIILGVLTDDDLERIQQNASLQTMKPVFEKKPKPSALPESIPPTPEPLTPTEHKDALEATATVDKTAIPEGESEKVLQALMDAEKPPITPEELGRILKSFNHRVPAHFKGIDQLTDGVVADAIKSWIDYRDVIKGERGASAP